MTIFDNPKPQVSDDQSGMHICVFFPGLFAYAATVVAAEENGAFQTAGRRLHRVTNFDRSSRMTATVGETEKEHL